MNAVMTVIVRLEGLLKKDIIDRVKSVLCRTDN